MLLIDKEFWEWYIIYASGCINFCIQHLKNKNRDRYSAVYLHFCLEKMCKRLHKKVSNESDH